MNDDPSKGLIRPVDVSPTEQTEADRAVPSIVNQSGNAAVFAWNEFVFGSIRNKGTRQAYRFAIEQFCQWCERQGLLLQEVAPAHVGKYFDQLAGYAAATKKIHLSALRQFFNQLVMRHVVILNPALSVRVERVSAVEGKTPAMTVKQVRRLLASVDCSSVVGLRDKAIIAILTYTAVRVGAIAKLKRKDFYNSGEQYLFRFTEKRNKFREIPVRFDLTSFMLEYIGGARLVYSDKATPLFRSAIGRTKSLSRNGMTPVDIARMLKRRLRDAGLPTCFSPHSFRVTTITDLLAQGVPLDDVQNFAGHSDPRTTKLYDRRKLQVTRNIVERISI